MGLSQHAYQTACKCERRGVRGRGVRGEVCQQASVNRCLLRQGVDVRVQSLKHELLQAPGAASCADRCLRHIFETCRGLSDPDPDPDPSFLPRRRNKQRHALGPGKERRKTEPSGQEVTKRLVSARAYAGSKDGTSV